MPTENALTVEFRASRGTIRRAIAVLREDGLIGTQHGRGSHTNAMPNPKQTTLNVEEKRGVSANAELASLFGVEIGTALIESQSVTREDSRVIKVARIYRLQDAEV